MVSGFLITTLLLREREATGRIRLGAFWRRRARRLLPALGVLVLVCCSAAYLVGRDVLVGLGAQVLGAVTFSSNWLFLAARADYFGSTVPELFRNLWSLAVEEQFYLLWPLLLVFVLLRVPRWLRIAGIVADRGRIRVAMAAAVDSGRRDPGLLRHRHPRVRSRDRRPARRGRAALAGTAARVGALAPAARSASRAGSRSPASWPSPS